MSFAELGLSPETLKAIEEVGYNTPTPIQEQAIPVVLMGRDVLGVAQTGTGKTASFTLPMIDILASGRAKARMPRSLIIAPTRELAAQVAENFDLYGKYHKLSMALLIGGESFTDQIALLDRGVDVLIATPGRLLDLFERGRILLNDVKVLVIDEADRMLDMGFIPDVERIVSLLPRIRQTLFFSATMAPEIRRLADAFLMNPKEISVAPPASPAKLVQQALVVIDPHDKREALRRLLRSEEVRNALIFCNRKRDVDILYKSLNKHGFGVAQLHGDMAQSARMDTLEQFKRNEVSLLVCSDVAARGIDIQALSHVFNFDVPIHAEDYVHRIGRTGRAGREGRAFTLAAPEDGRFVAAIEKLIGIAIPRIDIEGLETLELEMEDRRRRGRKRDEKPDRKRRDRKREPEGATAAAAEPGQPAPAAAEQPERPSRRTADQDRSARTPSRDTPSGDGRRNGRRRDREREHDRQFGIGEMRHPDDVVGFGDHPPDFILRTVTLAPATADADADADEGDAETEVTAKPARAEKPKRTRTPRRSSKGEPAAEPTPPADSAAETEDATDVATTAPEPAAEPGSQPEAVTADNGADKKPARKKSVRKTAAAGETKTPAKRKAAQAKTAKAKTAPAEANADADAQAGDAPEANAKPKQPRRRTRKAAPAEPDQSSESDAGDTGA